MADEVRQWLTVRGLGNYAEVLIKNGFDDMMDLGNLTDQDLYGIGIVHPGPLLMACSQIELPSSDLSICGLRSNNPEGVALDPVDVSVCRVPSESHAASRHARQPYENWTPVAARQASLETRERLYSNITFTTDDNGSSYGRLSDGTVLPNESIEYVTGGVRVHHLNGDSQVNGSFSFKTKKHSNMVQGWGLSASVSVAERCWWSAWCPRGSQCTIHCEWLDCSMHWLPSAGDSINDGLLPLAGCAPGRWKGAGQIVPDAQ
eukprot:m.912522 g.912522  ORF g.912522 m.912522 type:complete len:261 (+) comp23727_c0_seq18:3713-4495(+)